MSTLRNSVQLIGHLGTDPEVKTLEQGTKVARLRIATTDAYKDKNGQWQDETTWHNIVAWEGLAERAEKNLHKGSFVLIEGKLINRSYTDSKGEKKYIYEVRASNFLVLDKKEYTIGNNSEAPELAKDDLPF